LVTVQTQQDTSLAVDAASGTYGGTTTLSATLTKTSDGTGIGDKTIVFSLRGSAVCDNDTADATKPDCPKTNTSGVATLNNVSLSGIDAGGPTGTGYENAVSANFAADSGFKASNGSNSLTVNPKQITITPDSGQSKVYGQLDPTLAYTASSPLESGDSYTGKLGRATGENVGNYAINLGTLTAGANYDLKLSATPVNFAITARSITVTPDANQSKVYGDADPVLTFHLAAGSSLAFNDTLADATDGAPSRAQGENVGTYAIQQGTLTAAANNNYELHFDANGVTFAITPKAITVTADNKTKQLGATDPALTYQVTSGSLVQGDSFTGSLSRVAGENVGTYAIQQGSLSAGNNYTLTFKEGTLTIVYAGGFLGITQPINGGMGESIALTANSVGAGADPDFADDNSRFKLGSTVPVKFQLKDANGALVTNASAQLYLKEADSKPDPGVDEPISTAASTTGNLFRYDAMSGQYIFNLSTKNSSYTNPDGKVVPLAQGTYTISVKLDDNTYRSVNIQLVR
jgi:MBG domain (YGX type)